MTFSSTTPCSRFHSYIVWCLSVLFVILINVDHTRVLGEKIGDLLVQQTTPNMSIQSNQNVTSTSTINTNPTSRLRGRSRQDGSYSNGNDDIVVQVDQYIKNSTNMTSGSMNHSSDDMNEGSDGSADDGIKHSMVIEYAAGFQSTGAKYSFCAGVLISPTTVLTPASCVVNRKIKAIYVGGESPKKELIDVKAIRIHPLYGNGTSTEGAHKYNFALIELSTESNFPPVELLGPSVTNIEHMIEIGYQLSVNVHAGWTFGLTENLMRNATTNVCGFSPNGNEELCLETALADAADVYGIEPSDTEPCEDLFMGSPLIARDITVDDETKDYLVGLRFIDTECASGPERVATIFNAIEFINMYSSDHTWGTPPEHGFISLTRTSQQMNMDLPANKRYVVGLRETRDGQNFCGGTLISADLILTAAHCVAGGETNFVAIGSKKSFGSEMEIVPVLKGNTKIHPKYRIPHAFSYDIAIIQLKGAAAAKPVTIDTSKDFTGSKGIMYGYGATTSQSNTLSKEVKEIRLPILSMEQCAVSLPQVDDSVLCAGGEGSKDACTGDSGSPLIVSENGIDYLAGVVSAGHGCGLKGVPGIYMRISSIGDFIHAYSPNIGLKPTKNGIKEKPDASRKGDDIPTKDDKWFSLRSNTTLMNGGDQNDTQIHRTKKTGGKYDAAVNTLSMPVDLPPEVLDGVLNFIIGEYGPISARDILTQLLLSQNYIIFYSTGDLSGIMNVINRYRSSTLATRKRRFPRVYDGSSKKSYSC